MKIFDKPNEQSQARLGFAMARKFGYIIKLYHGSYTEIQQIDLKRSMKGKDFGLCI